ncbi:MAG: hypothetical protein LQ351_000141, partial [Letrouitia transgressa]
GETFRSSMMPQRPTANQPTLISKFTVKDPKIVDKTVKKIKKTNDIKNIPNRAIKEAVKPKSLASALFCCWMLSRQTSRFLSTKPDSQDSWSKPIIDVV